MDDERVVLVLIELAIVGSHPEIKVVELGVGLAQINLEGILDLPRIQQKLRGQGYEEEIHSEGLMLEVKSLHELYPVQNLKLIKHEGLRYITKYSLENCYL